MKNIIIILFFTVAVCSGRKINPKNDFIVANGQMPNVTKDNHNNLHLVYGIGDSIMYSYSSYNASSFSAPEKGEIVVINPDGQKKMLGRGRLPVLKALDDDHVICV